MEWYITFKAEKGTPCEFCQQCGAIDTGLGNKGCPAKPTPPGGCGKPGHVTATGKDGTGYCLTCEADALRAELDRLKPLVGAVEKIRMSNPRMLLYLLSLLGKKHCELIRNKMKRVKPGKEEQALKMMSAKQPKDFETKEDYAFYRGELRSSMDEMEQIIGYRLDIQDLLTHQQQALKEEGGR